MCILTLNREMNLTSGKFSKCYVCMSVTQMNVFVSQFCHIDVYTVKLNAGDEKSMTLTGCGLWAAN